MRANPPTGRLLPELSPDAPGHAGQPADDVSEVGAIVRRRVFGVGVRRDAVEQIAVDEPSAPGGAAADPTGNTELERTRREEGLEVVADARGPLADLKRPAVERTGDRIPV